jgi:hypothetical protein
LCARFGAARADAGAGRFPGPPSTFEWALIPGAQAVDYAYLVIQAPVGGQRALSLPQSSGPAATSLVTAISDPVPMGERMTATFSYARASLAFTLAFPLELAGPVVFTHAGNSLRSGE